MISSAADVTVKPAGSEQGSQSAVAASAAAVESAGTVTTTPDPAADDGGKAEPAVVLEEGGAAAPPAERPGEGGQQQQQQGDAVPRLLKVVQSARGVFRQRDVKEYDPFTAHLERRITKLFQVMD